MRKATLEDIDEISRIYTEARRFMKNSGNMNQWDDNYPSVEIIRDDILNENLYVIESKDIVKNIKHIAAVSMISLCNEKDYEKIYSGNWNSNDNYAVIHRFAVADRYRRKGISKIFFYEIFNMIRENGISWVRIDTHRENIPMQNFLEKIGFDFCGIVFIKNNEERIAYDLNLRRKI